jgi:hypothetical protein
MFPLCLAKHHATNKHCGSGCGGTDPHILNLGTTTRRVVSLTHQGKEPLHPPERLGGPQSQPGRGSNSKWIYSSRWPFYQTRHFTIILSKSVLRYDCCTRNSSQHTWWYALGCPWVQPCTTPPTSIAGVEVRSPHSQHRHQKEASRQSYAPGEIAPEPTGKKVGRIPESARTR